MSREEPTSASDERRPAEYASPSAQVADRHAGLRIARRFGLALGLGLLAFGAGWGLTPRPPHHIETAWMMGIGAAIAGFVLPSVRS